VTELARAPFSTVTTSSGDDVIDDTVLAALLDFLSDRTKATVAAEQDLFASGVVSSLFVMELVVHIETTFDVAIVGKDLNMDNFRTVRAMADLVLRLRDA